MLSPHRSHVHRFSDRIVYTALQTKGFVILSGISGTARARLPSGSLFGGHKRQSDRLRQAAYSPYPRVRAGGVW